ncbi:MAG TPA: hypothetical protein VMV94_21635 [Phycisphaerae bacterium]|nr:hypothetical protein [Phycisphaerae bacterium]
MAGRRDWKRCPHCGSRNVRLARRDEEPPHQLVLYNFRKCLECGIVYLPMSNRAHAVFLFISGSLFATMFTYRYLINSSTVIDLVLGGLGVLFALEMLWSGIHALRRRVA